MMKRSLQRIGLFLLLNLVLATLAIILVNLLEPSFSKFNWTTEATFSAIPENQKFDFVLMGTSHAREFSRSGNHQLVEKTTNNKFFNLSKGSGHGGLLPNLTAWKYFTQKGNTTNHVVYFIDPWVFFSSKWNDENYFLEDEALNLELFLLCLKSGYNPGVLINYIKSKFKPSYFTRKPISTLPNKKFLPNVDTNLINMQNKKNYLDGLDEKTFQKYTYTFKTFVQTLRESSIKVTIIIPPTLLGEEPGSKRLKEFLKGLNGIEYYDHTDLINERKLFYDLHHLNSEGIQQYLEKNLKVFVN